MGMTMLYALVGMVLIAAVLVTVGLSVFLRQPRAPSGRRTRR